MLCVQPVKISPNGYHLYDADCAAVSDLSNAFKVIYSQQGVLTALTSLLSQVRIQQNTSGRVEVSNQTPYGRTPQVAGATPQQMARTPQYALS